MDISIDLSFSLLLPLSPLGMRRICALMQKAFHRWAIELDKPGESATVVGLARKATTSWRKSLLVGEPNLQCHAVHGHPIHRIDALLRFCRRSVLHEAIVQVVDHLG